MCHAGILSFQHAKKHHYRDYPTSLKKMCEIVMSTEITEESVCAGGRWRGCMHACVTYAECRTLVCKLIWESVYASVIGAMVELYHVPFIPGRYWKMNNKMYFNFIEQKSVLLFTVIHESSLSDVKK